MEGIIQIHDQVLEAVRQEYLLACDKWPPFRSAHEGYAIILEELDELKKQVWKKQGERDVAAMQREAIQVAAMALRFATDVYR